MLREMGRGLLAAMIIVALFLLAARSAKAQETAAEFFGRDRGVWVAAGAESQPAGTVGRSRAIDIRPAPQIVSEKLLRVAMADLGRGKFTPYPGPWCRDALNAWLRRAGYRTDGDRRAYAALRLGRRLSGPAVGAIAIQRHHVGVVVAILRDRIIVVSGNSGRRVREASYRARQFIAFVQPG